MRNLLLVSNSTNHGSTYLSHCDDAIRDLLGEEKKTVLFIPFALADWDDYTRIAREKFAALGYDLVSAHEHDDYDQLFQEIDAIFIGGGNSFRLLKQMYERGLVERIRQAVLEQGKPYMGASAGSNVSTVDIKTTNDMPIVFPKSFDALGLVPFNINPHYLDPIEGSTHMGETRQKRIEEFLEENDNTVVGIREGAWLRVIDNDMTLEGNTARIFFSNGKIEEYAVGSDLSFLLTDNE